MRKLRTQLSLSIMFVVFITVGLISLFSNVMINSQFERYIARQHKAKTEDIVENIGQYYNASTRMWDTDSIHTLGMYALNDGYIIKVYNNDGKNVWDAENHDMALCGQIMDKISERMEGHGLNGEFVSHKYTVRQKGMQIGTAYISYFGPFFLNENDFSFLDYLNAILLIIGIFSILFSFVIGRLMAKRIAQPVTEISDIAMEIASGNYNARFEGETKIQELYNLIGTINHLAATLGKQEDLRRQLTANVAHELRTPLATLGSHLEAMVLRVWEPTQERLKSCHEEILRLGKLVADLEHIERVESSSLKLNKSSVDLLELAKLVCGNFQGELASKNLSFTIEGEKSVVSIDKDRISSVISNLMSNAIKYTPENGRIHVSIRDSERTSVFIIEDNGIGISEEEVPMIFERFYRADKSRNRNTGGAGLGLAIVRSIVAAHNGTVTVQSTLNSGSRFVVTLPK